VPQRVCCCACGYSARLRGHLVITTTAQSVCSRLYLVSHLFEFCRERPTWSWKLFGLHHGWCIQSDYGTVRDGRLLSYAICRRGTDNCYLTQYANDDTRSECSNPAADPHMYTGIGINFQRAIPTDISSPYTIAGLVLAVSPNE
jgi:hypothetical protein